MSAKIILFLIALTASVVFWCFPQSMFDSGFVDVDRYGLFEYVTVFSLPGNNSDYTIDEKQFGITIAATFGVWLPYILVSLDGRKRSSNK